MSLQFNDNIKVVEKVAATATFAQVEIEMPKSPARGLLPAIIMIEVQHPQKSVADKYSAWALCNDSNDAMPNLNDAEVIAKGIFYCDTSIGHRDMIEKFTPPAPVPISRDKLYLCFYQDTGSAHTYRVRIHWVPRYVKGVVQQQSMDVNVQF